MVRAHAAIGTGRGDFPGRKTRLGCEHPHPGLICQVYQWLNYSAIVSPNQASTKQPIEIGVDPNLLVRGLAYSCSSSAISRA